LSLAGHDDLQDYTTIPVFAIKGIKVDFTLDPNEPLRPLEGSGPVLDVPEGIAFTKFMYLPLVMRRASLR